jgi:8-oxo-dGTP pyrophosphatase MutT (NUDIX family)
MLREISAGGVVVRQGQGGWEVALIEPQREQSVADKSDKKGHARPVLALPKGLVDPGEKPEQTAVREVREETGVSANILRKLTDIKYVYVRSWSDRQRVFKIVSFYLLKYESGAIGDVSPEMRIEVKRALWVPLDQAERMLAYRGERDVLKLARKSLETEYEERTHGTNRS